jgi:hypothetical protein
MSTETNQKLVDELTRILKFWFRLGVRWAYAHWVVGILGVATSALAATDKAVGEAAPLFAVAATICFGIIGFTNPQQRSAKYIRSYRLLDAALREYKYAGLCVDQLLKAHRRAEDLLNETDSADIEIRKKKDVDGGIS